MTSITVFCLLIILTGSVSNPVREKRFLLGDPIHTPIIIKQPTYKAAVYNHEVILPVGVTTRAQALEAMSKNLDIYDRQAAIAHQQNVDILVFPEDGLYGANFTRETIQPFLERIPDPKAVSWNPCLQPNLYQGTEIQYRLSCMARNQSLYIVANMGSTRPCTSEDFFCTRDSLFLHNTDVVFDRTGLLVARSEKGHLLNETFFDDVLVTTGTFDTTFGRFALASSYESLFHQRIIDTIEDFKVDSVAFPTRLMDTSPMLSGFQWQAAFSAGMRVNVLAANQKSAGGSGIYTPTGPAVYVTDNNPAQLLIATIPSRPINFNGSEALINVKPDKNTFQSFLFGNDYNFVELIGENGTAAVCNGTFCCQAVFTRNHPRSDRFVLGAFFGLHRDPRPFGLQVCALLKCAENSGTNCEQVALSSETYFTKLILTGNFDTRYVFPEISVATNGTRALLHSDRPFFKYGTLQSDTGFSHPLLSVVLIGRVYSLHFGLE